MFDSRQRVRAAPGQRTVAEDLVPVDGLFDGVGSRATDQRIVAVRSQQGVVTVGSVQGHRAQGVGRGVETIVSAAAGDREMFDRHQGVVAGAHDRRVGQHQVAVKNHSSGVGIVTTVQGVGSRGAREGVVAGCADERYRSGGKSAGVQIVVAGSAGQDRLLDRNQLVAALPGQAGVGDRLVAVDRLPHLVAAGAAVDEVVSGTAVQGVVAGESQEGDRAEREAAGIQRVV